MVFLGIKQKNIIACSQDIIQKFAGAVIVISHDRSFLTHISKTTFWLDRGILRRNNKSFSFFEEWENQVIDQEIIEQKTSPVVAENVVNLLLKSENVVFVDTYFCLRLIESDPDDNKFVDCAFAASATYIVSDDNHFDVLKDISFPPILVLKLKAFLAMLKSGVWFSFLLSELYDDNTDREY